MISGNSNNNSSNDINRDKGIIVVVIILFQILAGIGIFFVKSDYSVPEFEVDSLSMKVYNNTEKRVTADLNFTVTLKNKDEGLLYFDQMQVSLEYHQNDEVISSTSLDAFVMDDKERQIQFGMLINAQIYQDNVLLFGLKAQGHYVRPRDDCFDKCDIKLVCDDIGVGFFPEKNSTIIGILIVSPIPCKCKSQCKSISY